MNPDRIYTGVRIAADALILAENVPAPKKKQLYVSKILIEKRAVSLKNITSKEGIRYRMNRSIQVEGAFGVIKNNYGFKRFLSKGAKNINIDILFLCLGYNINKLHSKIMNNRLGVSLFKENEVA